MWYRTVLFRSVPKSGTERGLRSHADEKKSSSPFQNRSRSWVVRKREPESGTIRYCTVLFSCEQKYDIVPFCFFCSLVNRKTGPVYVHFPDLFGFYGDTKLVSMTTSNAEVEIRPNYISLILTIVSSF